MPTTGDWKVVHVQHVPASSATPEVKTIKYKSPEALREQLFSSFSLGALGPIELLDESGAIVALGDLENDHTYFVPQYEGLSPEVMPRAAWTGRDALFQTKCPVHDIISLPDYCRAVIDTPEFQRLRDLAQLGICSRVFVGGRHSRFEHSLGTAHLAFKLTSLLKIKQPELGISAIDVLCVTIAALCHDLGHSLHSHLAEVILPECGLPDWEHEQASLMMVDRVLGKVRAQDEFDPLSDADVVFIKALIHPPGDAGEWTEKAFGREKKKKFLFEIVSNKRCGIDVDKFDYIQRDCHYTGVRGVFEVDRMIMNARVCEAEGDMQIVWPQKEVENIWELLHTRASLHRRVYQHRTTKALDGMLRDAYALAAPHMKFSTEENPDSLLSFAEAHQNPDTFLHISDWLAMHLLHGPFVHTDFAHPDVQQARQILQDIQHRKIWKFVGSTKGFAEDPLQFAAELSVFSGSRLPPSAFEVRNTMYSWGMGDTNPIANITFCTKEGELSKLRTEDASKMLPASFKEHIIVVFVKRMSPEDKAVAREAFSRWCRTRGLKADSNDGTSLSLTNCRKRPRSSSLDDIQGLAQRHRADLNSVADSGFSPTARLPLQTPPRAI